MNEPFQTIFNFIQYANHLSVEKKSLTSFSIQLATTNQTGAL
jgi:hypothetical protein